MESWMAQYIWTRIDGLFILKGNGHKVVFATLLLNIGDGIPLTTLLEDYLNSRPPCPSHILTNSSHAPLRLI